jgi:hypothetical protein
MKLWTKAVFATLLMGAFLTGCNKAEEPAPMDAAPADATSAAPADAPAAAPAEPAKEEPGGWVPPESESK